MKPFQILFLELLTLSVYVRELEITALSKNSNNCPKLGTTIRNTALYGGLNIKSKSLPHIYNYNDKETTSEHFLLSEWLTSIRRRQTAGKLYEGA